VKGGQIIGATDSTGGKVIDPGWTAGRSIYIEDIAATMYSALGIDWGRKLLTHPLGEHLSILNLSQQQPS